jgi:hypothetical protein
LTIVKTDEVGTADVKGEGKQIGTVSATKFGDLEMC